MIQSLKLNWHNAKPAIDDSDGAITIVIPVYGALQETLACIHSVLTTTRETPAHLIVIDDCSPDPGIHGELCHASEGGRLFTVWQNAKNQGFVSTANRGILAAKGDVVLLNSDTLVTDAWLDHLVRYARQDDAVASVSPMSNNATILSYPRMNAANSIPADTSLSELGCFFSDNFDRFEPVTCPVNVGFCMLLTARAINAIGAFDEALFGIGYGEECDWCMRANYFGFNHVIAIDTFIYHVGSVSFSARSANRQELAAKSLALRHPTYWGLIGQFCADDPLLKVRRVIDVRRLISAAAKKKGIIVHVLHRLGGGTRVHALKLAELLDQEGYGSVFVFPDESGQIAVGASFMGDLHTLCFNCVDDAPLLQELLDGLDPLYCHIHALIGFSQRADVFIKEIAAPKVLTLHDYIAICPQITLLNETGSFCDLPSNVRCNSCLRKKPPPIACSDIGRWRRDWFAVLSAAERILAPSRFVEDVFHRLYPDLEIVVVPHDVGVPKMLSPMPVRSGKSREAPDRAKLRQIAIFGNMNHHKGVDVVVTCAADARDADLPLQFVLFGQAPGVTGDFGGKLLMMGPYDHSSLPAMLRETECEIGFLPSIWPETYSYVLSEIIELGLHPVVFDLGAQAERCRQQEFGTILPLGMSPTTLNMALMNISPAPAEEALLKATRSPLDVALDRSSYLDSLYGKGWRQEHRSSSRTKLDA